ncbi:putative HEPN AbiU2-like domain-containing protein [Vibrio crassostreae]|uniref:hypothetical protein n=1 Tax=Vibrio TaxID=662 RepID=UPI0005E0AE82|nr:MULTISPECIES: hypothetical protein [Vibrio]CAH7303936.1 conserved hypothetical protein [Vibrio chagasii]MDP2592686.1 hypothetical protein [Vibrio splendidus]TCT63339.1 hypothetical protein EDB44_10684 [Vibrio crassostreae]TCT84180.1 hypothetical protein EDB43_106124 [Vibrio crassostreae]TCU04610.1 hypothetical protein EDB47_10784 [Vibrio crassostreae]
MDEQHTDLIKFYEQCDWAWQIHILMKTYCNTEELIGWCSLDVYLSVILKEYAVLQIAKIHDAAESGKNKNHSLLFYCKKYGIQDELEVERFLSECKAFYSGMKKARHKIIAHCDLEQIQNDNVIGAYKPDVDLEYFSRLHTVITRLYHVAGIGSPPKWSELIHKESAELVKILSKLNEH